MLCLTALTSPDVTDGTGQNPLLTPFNTTVTSILSFVNGQNTVLEPSLFALSGVLLGEDWHPGKTPPPRPRNLSLCSLSLLVSLWQWATPPFPQLSAEASTSCHLLGYRVEVTIE